jgi:iron complex transport system ATP-binding protein
MENKTVEIRNLAIGYRNKKQEKRIACNLHSTIYNGELTCLLGANGIGKSTLLRTLSGLQPKLSGEIFISGKEIDSYSCKELSRIIGVVLTEKIDIRDMSVIELICLGRSPYTGFWGNLDKKDEAIVKKAISLVKIDNLTYRPVHTLSDGERQKVMIAKVLAQETPVIYLDEPTAFLDFPSKVEIIRILHRLSRQTDKIIFLSTHDLDLALQMADKLWLMGKGKEITVGSPQELAANGDIEKFFQGDGIVFDSTTNSFRIIKPQ